MKNILFIYDAPLRPEAGGTERATKLVMDELSNRGYNCKGILHFNQAEPENQYLNGEKISSIYEFLKQNKIDIVVNQIAFHPRFLNQFLNLGGKRWKEEGGKIISFMHLDPTPAPRKKICSYLTGLKNKNIIGILKRLIYISLLPVYNYNSLKKYRYGLKEIYEKSDRYILMSNSFIPIFANLARLDNTEKIRIIPNMLTFPKIANESILERKEKIVLVVARLDDEQKNISFIIDAWSKIKDHRGYKLHIVGDGTDREKLHQKAKLTSNIIFEGQQSPLQWYERAKIFLMASPREGWGLTITESLQNGVVPIVLNTSTVFNDIIQHRENGYLANNKIDYILYLSELLNDDIKLRNIGLNGLKSAYRYSNKIIGDKWDNLLNDLN